jgi:hypothetical protein
VERETREGQRGHWALTLSMNRQKDLNPWAPQAGVVEPNLVPEGPRKGKVGVRVEAAEGLRQHRHLLLALTNARYL